MQTQIVLSLFGLAAGLLLLAWVEPITAGGTTLLVALCVILINAFGTVLVAGVRLFASRTPSQSAARPVESGQKKQRKMRGKARRTAVTLVPTALLCSASALAQGSSTRDRAIVAMAMRTYFTAVGHSFQAAQNAVIQRDKPSAVEHINSTISQVLTFPKITLVENALVALIDARFAAASDDFDQAYSRLHSARDSLDRVDVDSQPSVATIINRGQASQPVPVGRPPARRPLHPARTFLAASDIPPPEVGAYGVLALRAKPTPATQARLKAVCASFLASLPASKTLPSRVPVQDHMLTVWPLATAEAPDVKADDCDYLLQNYDLHGGISAILDADQQGNELRGQGPFLVGWSPAKSRREKDAVVLVLDLSPFDSQQSFDEMFLLWQRRIVEDPALWRTGFSAERLRLVLRDFVDRYGQGIIESLKLVKLGG